MIGLMVVMFMSYSLVVNLVLVLSGVGLNFLPSSLSVIQQEMFKKTVLVVRI